MQNTALHQLLRKWPLLQPKPGHPGNKSFYKDTLVLVKTKYFAETSLSLSCCKRKKSFANCAQLLKFFFNFEIFNGVSLKLPHYCWLNCGIFCLKKWSTSASQYSLKILVFSGSKCLRSVLKWGSMTLSPSVGNFKSLVALGTENILVNVSFI